MHKTALIAAALLAAAPLARSQAQTGATMCSGHANAEAAPSPNSLPAGAMNATSGPQSRPAYPSGASTPNPGAPSREPCGRRRAHPRTSPA